MAVPLYPAICPGHQKGVVEISYSRTTADGTFFISACLDKLPMLRDAKSGDWIGTFQGHKGAVWSARLNGNATLAATGSADFSAKLWDAVGGTEIATLEHGHVVKSVDFSHDGRRLATGGQDKKLRVFDVERPLAQPGVVVSGPDRIRKVAWSADDRLVYAGSEDGALRSYDGATGRLVNEAQLGAGAVTDLEVSPDGRTLTVSAGREVLLLDAGTLEATVRHRLGFAVSSASLHPSTGRHFVAGGSDVHVHLLDAGTGEELACHKGHHGIVHCVRFAPDGGTYVSGADDAIVRIWKYDGAPDAKGGKGGRDDPSQE